MTLWPKHTRYIHIYIHRTNNTAAKSSLHVAMLRMSRLIDSCDMGAGLADVTYSALIYVVAQLLQLLGKKCCNLSTCPSSYTEIEKSGAIQHHNTYTYP